MEALFLDFERGIDGGGGKLVLLLHVSTLQEIVARRSAIIRAGGTVVVQRYIR